ncbi:MAG: SGNH/GDSL hydrolase family protein [Deltaproteobacteria bacterium]|nr:SGNH/GDSL hydrolase family protein [Deltaproteobacteria bacterium]
MPDSVRFARSRAGGGAVNTGEAIKRLLAVLMALGLFLVLGEVLIRVYLGFNIAYDIEMTRYALYMKQDAGDPRVGHVHRPNSAMRLMGVPVEINSDGLRDKEYPVERGDAYRIAFLGDSLTFGWGVKQEETFQYLLEEKLSETRPTEIINFGTGNYNTAQEVGLFLAKGLKYRPDEVVLFYFINDAEVTPAKSKLWFLGYSELISFYWSRINSLKDRYAPSQDFAGYYSALYAEGQPGWKEARAALLELKETCRESGIRLRVVLLPELHDTRNEIFAGVYGGVAEFLGQNGIEHLNLARLFEARANPMELWVSYDDAHPNAIAHRAVAESIAEFVATTEQVRR